MKVVADGGKGYGKHIGTINNAALYSDVHKIAATVNASSPGSHAEVEIPYA